MTTTLTMAPAVRFHLSLNVADLARSVAFYRTLFNVEPAKQRPDYAKFELESPPLVLSLEPTPRGAGGALNHLGFRLTDSAALVAMQERLERAGIRSQREEGVECCYARQTKFWVQDPDQTLWEIYTLEADLEHRGAGQSVEAMLPAAASNGVGTPVTWEQNLMAPVPDAIPLGDNSADEVRLRGSLNAPLSPTQQQRLATEARRVLKPGGRLFVHVLVGDRPLTSPPSLPGPASVVRQVPLQSEPVRLLESAGFQNVRLLKFDAKPCFQQQGAAMRELQLEGWKEETRGEEMRSVLYKGPFRQVTDDSGTVFPRGEWINVGAAVARKLQAGDGAEQFVVVK